MRVVNLEGQEEYRRGRDALEKMPSGNGIHRNPIIIIGETKQNTRPSASGGDQPVGVRGVEW